MPGFADFTANSISEVLVKFHSSLDGLTSEDAEGRLKLNGKNQIASQKISWLDILIRQFKSPFVYLLAAASVITLLLNEKTDSIFIILFIGIDVGLGFIQEYRSEQAVKLLKKYITVHCTVLRDQQEIEVPTTDIATGDILKLEPGDIIPADVRFIQTDGLTLDESILTGESTTVTKFAKSIQKTSAVYKASNVGFMGTSVISGEAKAVVIATGKFSEFGKVAKLTTQTKRVSSFEKEIGKFSNFILRLVIVTLILLFAANIFIKRGGENPLELAIFSVALAVSVIPEALPVVTTFSLSKGSLILARKKVIVKRLSSIEDLGGIEILCTDKTGTITQNEQTIDRLLEKDKRLMLFASLASENKLSDSFDVAIDKKLTATQKQIWLNRKIIDTVPFDPIRRRVTTLVDIQGKKYIISRGSYEMIFKLSRSMDAQKLQFLHNWASSQGKEGKRVLAVGYKKLNVKPKNILSAEKNLRFAGLISFYDPLKSTTKEAVSLAEKLGVQIKILTGDSLEVGTSIAQKAGIITSDKQAILAEDFFRLTTSQQISRAKEINVWTRVNPEQKFQIIKLLQQDYEVGFLGEGINDSPALKIANVGLVVNHATDIARDAADIVLLQKDLKVIIDGIKQGRQIFANNSKYITATLSSNFGNFYAVAISSLLIPFLPMLPLQILLVNLLSDFPMISIATDNVDNETLAKPSRAPLGAILVKATVLGIVSTIFDFIFFAIFVRVNPPTLQTAWFMGSVITELLFLYSIRTNRFFIKSIRPSLIIFVLTFVAIAITIVLPFSQIGHEVFQFISLNPMQLSLVIGICIAYFVITEATKLIYVRSLKRTS